MGDGKKDLTNLIEAQKDFLESDQMPQLPEGSSMEEAPIEKIDHFESLEEYSNDFPVTPPDPASVGVDGEALPAPLESQVGDLPNAGSDFPNPDFLSSDAEAQSSDTPSSDLSFSEPTSSESLSAHPTSSSPPSSSSDLVPSTPDLKPEPNSNPTEPSTLEKVKTYSETLKAGKPAVPAAFPFSVLITGKLTPEEKEKIIDLLNRENMGIREMDIEPQLNSGRILLPRISEYAAIYLVQALRGIHAQIKVGPSDSIFSTDDTRADTAEEMLNIHEENEFTSSADIIHPAEQIPVTTEDRIVNFQRFVVIDTVVASAALKSTVVEVENSSQYQEIVENLQRELKYKAFRKGASAIIHFKIQLNFLSSPTHYRIMAIGQAIRPLSAEEPLHPSRPPA